MNDLSSYKLVPQPLNLTPGDGSLELSPTAVIVADERLRGPAELLAARLRQGMNRAWEFSSAKSGEQAIEFRLNPAITHPEGYTLRVDATGIVVEAATAGGAYYGAQTLLQLFPPVIFGPGPVPGVGWSLPFVSISDEPRFRWRGVMLDSVRHFWPVEYICKFIDLLGQHKINVFHWHLTDDQGWRIEIKKYPRLTEIGSYRSGSLIGHQDAPVGYDSVPVEGYYTQDQIREIVAYAKARNIEILPEIEMPGHAQAAIAAYPELGVRDEKVKVSQRWAIHDPIYSIKPSTFDFLKDVLSEVIDLFPYQYIHVGGDEAVKTQWKEDAATQAHIQKLELQDEHHLQSWFIGEINEFLKASGRKLIGWDEILEGGLVQGATVMSWRGEAGGVAAAKQGADVVMSTYNAYYFDYYQSPDRSSEPLTLWGNNTLEVVYTFEPVPEALTDDEAKHVIGIQAQLWTEYIPNISRLEYMAFPRISALSEVAWSPKQTRSLRDFAPRLFTHLRRLDIQDVRYRAPFELLI